MALPLGKLTILVGAGIVGSVLATKEGSVSDLSNFFSGAVKIFWRQLREDNSTPSSAKPRNDSLLAQVNSLRQELQILASNRSVTVVTTGTSGSNKYGVIVVVVVVGYGYIWWKGWKLPDLMFATKRSLTDACNNVAKQLEDVYASISAARRHLSSRLDRVDSSLDECGELTASTKEEVSELRLDMQDLGVGVQSVHHAVRTLESRITQMETKQVRAVEGVTKLVGFVQSLENKGPIERIQGAPSSSSRPALEIPQLTPAARSGSLPPTPPPQLPSPSTSNGSQKVQRHLRAATSASGLKELQGISHVVVEEEASSPAVSNGQNKTEDNNGNYNSGGVFGRKIPSIGASFLTRTRSAMQSFK